ncbi:MAG: AbrB/MazE/SpoVT family DNA-binding domain-containing protein [Promicromonosporaceae bacterium]|nr:AbrB/MazE/SpoVT family DNA-binding domain-containing protein [Promicromonosporaceae bacterium]
MVTKRVVQLGNSRAVVLPKAVCDRLEIDTGTVLELAVYGDSLIAKKPKDTPIGEVRSIDELFAGYSGSITNREPDWGEPRGAEIW